MWTRLQDPTHVQFYLRLEPGDAENHWMPMARAVQHLQSLEIARELYAFTSLHRFHVTTAPTYADCDHHGSVSIIWHVRDQRFHIAFGRLADGWVHDRAAERVCDESEFPSAIAPFLERLRNLGRNR